MSSNIKNESRRRLLRNLTLGGGVAVTVKTLPKNWTKPVINQVFLPAHAQTTPSICDDVEIFFSSNEDWQVPAGATTITAVLAGGSGGDGAGINAVDNRGLGAVVSIDLTVVPLETLQIRIGGRGSDGSGLVGGSGTLLGRGGDGADGSTNQRNVRAGGGGGGVTVIRSTGPATTIAAAGGGGGGAGDNPSNATPGAIGGNGGGGTGGSNGAGPGPKGGRGGPGGLGGSPNGGDSSGPQGGNAGGFGAGGGGGGDNGAGGNMGGGGGGGSFPNARGAPGAGGGGAGLGTEIEFNDGDGWVRIQYCL